MDGACDLANPPGAESSGAGIERPAAAKPEEFSDTRPTTEAALGNALPTALENALGNAPA